MKVLGIDPSSTKCGIALVEDGKLLNTWCWKKNATKSGVWNLSYYYDWLEDLIYGGAINVQRIADMACVEFLSVERNAQTTRKVSHFQAVSALVAKQAGLIVIEGRVSSARKEALGRGNLSKEEAWQAIRKMFPDHEFLRADLGGYDESDATVLALAGPGLAEGK